MPRLQPTQSVPSSWKSWTFDVSFSIPDMEKCCSITPRSRVLLEKLIGFQLVKKFPTFYGTRRFITAFTSARHLSLSWASSIQSIPPHPTHWRFILLLSSHLRLGLPSGLFSSGFPPRTCIHLSSPPYVLRALPISFLSILSPEQYLVSSTDHSAPHYVVFCTPLLPRPY